jgi:N-methylhydantoinase A/oxoprolinase/acetone carboxylase beta subunit
VETPVYDRYALAPGSRLEGPAIIEERESTTVIGPGEVMTVDDHRTLIAEPAGGETR